MAAKARIAVLRAALSNTSKPCIAMSAHNPLSAKLAAEAGFPAIWASGFELSASYAVPDASILPMSAHLEMARSGNPFLPPALYFSCSSQAVAETVNIPIIADIDTGFGNAVSVAYNVPKFEAAGASAVVMEDKTFPKDSSLRSGGRQVLVSIEEFQGKIEAAKASCKLGMLIIARTEALIAGLGEEEALKRGMAYVDAGADAILIHSKQRTPDEIISFCKAWNGKVPLVIVPTAYPKLSFAEVGGLNKVGLIICGNHAIRSAVAGMRSTFKKILDEGGIAGVEKDIASVKEIFELQGDAHMRELERKYLR
ncbi:probable Phosphonopyruvate hydrolase [Phialocephala subalpina]|uniref:Probable Phosphonopyruvate hydrolase n=1 Tax=Phialocephala subalpina TaxID=576137 RepID=A0A1L7WS93_9HELO|nr:probable Phosphonopyruvate hydrolase [Phialocephala subalpina]